MILLFQVPFTKKVGLKLACTWLILNDQVVSLIKIAYDMNAKNM